MTAGTEAEWSIAVDIGSVMTAAAMSRSTHPERLGTPTGIQTRSVVVARGDRLVAGRAAEAILAGDPAAVAVNPRRALAGGAEVPAEEVYAAILGDVLATAGRRRGGARPSSLTLTHPAHWTGPGQRVLARAAELAGAPVPTLIAEPIAAARHAVMALGLPAPLPVLRLEERTLDLAVALPHPPGLMPAAPMMTWDLPETGDSVRALWGAVREALGMVIASGLRSPGGPVAVHLVGEPALVSDAGRSLPGDRRLALVPSPNPRFAIARGALGDPADRRPPRPGRVIGLLDQWT